MPLYYLEKYISNIDALLQIDLYFFLFKILIEDYDNVLATVFFEVVKLKITVVVCHFHIDYLGVP